MNFQHIETGGAAAGHEDDDNIYWLKRLGQCYVFEADLYTVAVDAPKHYLTKTESQALKRHLNDIVQSIRIKS